VILQRYRLARRAASPKPLRTHQNFYLLLPKKSRFQENPKCV
jgi:hypothetical protein